MYWKGKFIILSILCLFPLLYPVEISCSKISKTKKSEKKEKESTLQTTEIEGTDYHSFQLEFEKFRLVERPKKEKNENEISITEEEDEDDEEEDEIRSIFHTKKSHSTIFTFDKEIPFKPFRVKIDKNIENLYKNTRRRKIDRVTSKLKVMIEE